MKRHPRTFPNIQAEDIYEFFPIGVDPNASPKAAPWQGGPVEVHDNPHKPGPEDGDPSGLMVRAGKGRYRVKSTEYQAWMREGGYHRRDLR